MRITLLTLCLAVLVGAAQPADAQLRSDVPSEQAPVRLYGQEASSSFSLNDLFSPQQFEMHHSFEMASGSFRGGYAYGMYTNTMLWQFNDELAARVDVSYMQDFGGTLGMESRLGGTQQGQFFLRNAEIKYQPSENVHFHLQVRQSPQGRYLSPYGRTVMPGSSSRRLLDPVRQN